MDHGSPSIGSLIFTYPALGQVPYPKDPGWTGQMILLYRILPRTYLTCSSLPTFEDHVIQGAIAW